MDKPKALTIDEMIASIGNPRNYAEQCVLRSIASERQVAASTIEELGRLGIAATQIDHVLWILVHHLIDVIKIYRDYGQHPCINAPDYPAGEVQE